MKLDTLEDVITACEAFQTTNGYALSYLASMREAHELYGMKGLKTQVLYFLNNVRAKGPEQQKNKKELTKWAQAR